ncbi:hypothetical protein DVR12_22560 [Chitinophaga silvatica]|uniref:Uncharacterized protein n=1 Tax=Chitinophaga silvatica TaxID=2282649 RepID=A0A3E1Y3Y3_9BACT|nr:hypothetical protein [Chitinophaga silvatica]RFS19420.1 hypothetical protein DVR12_22560 [Chitinophaga silvatica]
MQKERLVIILLSVCLLIATVLAVSGFYYKPASNSPVSMVFQGNNYTYQHNNNLNNVRYWNNYPYQVMMSEGKLIDTTISIAWKMTQDSIQLIRLRTSDQTVFLRIPSVDVNISNLDSICKIIRLSNIKVNILVDQTLIRIVDSYHADDLLNTQTTYILTKPLNIEIEHLNKPYFFTLDNSYRVSDVFVPRMEIMEVLTKYLASHSNI